MSQKNECETLDPKDEVHYACYDEVLVINSHLAMSKVSDNFQSSEWKNGLIDGHCDCQESH